jgi:outer membrane biosynthesis protein TonB
VWASNQLYRTESVDQDTDSLSSSSSGSQELLPLIEFCNKTDITLQDRFEMPLFGKKKDKAKPIKEEEKAAPAPEPEAVPEPTPEPPKEEVKMEVKEEEKEDPKEMSEEKEQNGVLLSDGNPGDENTEKMGVAEKEDIKPMVCCIIL